MGQMMGTSGGMGAWMILWIVLGIALTALAVAGGVWAGRALSRRRGNEPAQITATESPALREARDLLRQRYARGEISREDYLQGKVELED